MQRYVVLESRIQRLIGVVKVRGSAHSPDLRLFTIARDGIVIGEALSRYEGLLTGSPELIPIAPSKASDADPKRRRGSPPARR
jgi:circadian clock protein KaiC